MAGKAGEHTHVAIPDDQVAGSLGLAPAALPRPGQPAAVAAEAIARVLAELPKMAGLGQREELLAAVWLMSLRSARTRRAYAGDLRAWLAWLGERGVDVLAATRVHVDL